MRIIPMLFAVLVGVSFAQPHPPACEFEKLVAGDAQPNDRFGASLALSGELMAVGAPEMVGGAGSGIGSAYVHRWDGYRWRFEAKLVPSDGALQDVFGLSIATDGERVLVGAPLSDGAGDASGSAYIFSKDGEVWAEEQKVVASDAAPRRLFGGNVLIHGDLAIVSAAASVSPPGPAGAVYVFQRTQSGWSEAQRIQPTDSGGGDLFGYSLSLSGERLLIGALDGFEPCPQPGFCGAAYVFKRVGSQWQQEQKLVSQEPMPGDGFGSSVSLQDDWTFVGASGRDDVAPDAGAVDVYRYVGEQWMYQTTLAPSELAMFDRFPFRLQISGDRLAATSLNSDIACPATDPDCNAGAAFVFQWDGAEWVEHEPIVASDATAQHGFGRGFDLEAGRGAVGAWNDDDAGSDAGAVYMLQFAYGGPGSGDGDFDADVDWVDFARFMICFDKPLFTTCCSVFDFDDDDDVDLFDYEAHLDAVTGP